MAILFRNNAVGTLAQGVLASDVAIQLGPGQGDLFPEPTGGDYFLVSLQNGTTIEIMRCVQRVGNVLTVVRAQEGTAATDWGIGTVVEMRVTMGMLETFAQNPVSFSWTNLEDRPVALTTIGALTPAADRVPFYTSGSAASLAILTNFARTLLDDTSAAAARTTLGAFSVSGGTINGALTVSPTAGNHGIITVNSLTGLTGNLSFKRNGVNRFQVQSRADANFLDIFTWNDAGDVSTHRASLSRSTGQFTFNTVVNAAAAPTSDNHLTNRGYVLAQLANKVAVVNRQVFTTSGTWNKPAGLPSNAVVFVQAWGGGGGGSQGVNNVEAGGGGGSYAEAWLLAAALSSSVSVIVGSGGAPGVTGGSGGTSNFSSFCAGFGGGGGRFQSASYQGGGGGRLHAAGLAGGGAATGTSATGTEDAFYGGDGGGGSPTSGSFAGGPAIYGGGGGGGGSSGVGGFSRLGGAGGNSGVAGSIPGGGGGRAASGARGEVRVYVIA